MNAKVLAIVEKENEASSMPEVWGQSQDGVQVSLNFLGIKEISYRSAGATFHGTGSVLRYPEWGEYPPRGTLPHLLVHALVKNTSEKTVYLIGDKSRNGTSAPAFLQIQIVHGNDPPKLLNLHPDPFEYLGVDELEPGRTRLFHEYVPYQDFASLAPDCKMVGLVSFVFSEPARDHPVKADGVSYSFPLTPPWDALKLYFDLVN